jgi:hypothetical protein
MTSLMPQQKSEVMHSHNWLWKPFAHALLEKEEESSLQGHDCDFLLWQPSSVSLSVTAKFNYPRGHLVMGWHRICLLLYQNTTPIKIFNQELHDRFTITRPRTSVI